METQFETHGYFEEFLLVNGGKFVGQKKHNELPEGRQLGYDGRKIITLTENLVLDGNKVVKASPTKPVQVVSMFQRLCGRTLQS